MVLYLSEGVTRFNGKIIQRCSTFSTFLFVPQWKVLKSISTLLYVFDIVLKVLQGSMEESYPTFFYFCYFPIRFPVEGTK